MDPERLEAYRRLTDILKDVSGEYDKWKRAIRRITETASDERSRMALQTLDTHLVILKESLVSVIGGGPKGMLDTWIQYIPVVKPGIVFENAFGGRDPKPVDVSFASEKAFTEIRNFFMSVSEQVSAADHKDMLRSLANQTDSEYAKMKVESVELEHI